VGTRHYLPSGTAGTGFGVSVVERTHDIVAVTSGFEPGRELALYIEGGGASDPANREAIARLLAAIAGAGGVKGAVGIPGTVTIRRPWSGETDTVHFHPAPREDFPDVPAGREVIHAAVDFDGTYDPARCCTAA